MPSCSNKAKKCQVVQTQLRSSFKHDSIKSCSNTAKKYKVVQTQLNSSYKHDSMLSYSNIARDPQPNMT